MVFIIDPQNAGISGNMLLGAFIDIGIPQHELKSIINETANHFGEVTTNIEKINKKGISSTQVTINAKDKKPTNYKTLQNKITQIQHDLLNPEIIKFTQKVFHKIAQAESQTHQKTLDQIHFHEIGCADAVADIIGSAYAYHTLELNKQKVYGLPPALGGGTTQTKHGRLPIPAPATALLLKNTPTIGGPINKELTTPTGAALYTEMVNEYIPYQPLMQISKIGYGAGTMNLDFPNILRLIQGTTPIENEKITILETNIDHLSGETMGYLFEKLMNEGALDVSLTPIIMKKNRPGNMLKVICKSNQTDNILKTIFQETGTLGIRVLPHVHRSQLKRQIKTFNTTYGPIKVKIAKMENTIINARPEYEDLRKIAKKQNIPLEKISKIIENEIHTQIKGTK